MKSFLKFISFLLLIAIIAAGLYIFQDGTAKAARHYVELIALLQGPALNPPRPAAPVATPAPVVAVATPPPPTPTPVIPTPVPAAMPDPNDPQLVLKSLGTSRDEWPREVSLKRRAELPVI